MIAAMITLRNARSFLVLAIALLGLLLAGCTTIETPAAAVNAAALAGETPVAETRAQRLTTTPRPLLIPTATPRRAPLPTITPAIVPPTPDPYAGLTIADLRADTYGEGDFRVEQVLGQGPSFTRYLISYDSDGLRTYGFMNVPTGAGPFPVVLVNHGYVEPSVYRVLTYTTRYADALANAGFVAIHPNYRNYPPSDEGSNEFRVGYTRDILNLVGLVQRLGGQPGPLEAADPDAIGLWGHSMGGGITLRAITVSDAIDAALLYGAMSGDEARNHERILFFTNGANGLWEEGEAPGDADLRRLSPIYYLADVEAPVSIHHGEFDDQVPLAWSEELCTELLALGKTVECFTYPGAPHTFSGETDALFMERAAAFFRQNLQGGE
jgi:dipeptidyl aminopeptidase/acylaminoacyl peptidase